MAWLYACVAAVTRYFDDGIVPIDNRTAVMLSLIESIKLNGHDPWAYLKDVFERLPTLKDRDLELLLPHNNWRPADNEAALLVPAASATAPATAALSAPE